MSAGGRGRGGERRFGLEQGRRGIGSIATEIGRQWRAGDATARAGLGVAGIGGLALAGATAFGIVHVVGGAWHGNPRAIGFGVALSTVGMWSLAGLAALVRAVIRRNPA